MKYTKADMSEATTMESAHQQTESKTYQIAPISKYLASIFAIQLAMTKSPMIVTTTSMKIL